LKNVHPQNIVREVFPVYAATERLQLAICTKKGPVTRRGKNYIAVFFDHPQFEGREIYCATRYANPVAEGDPTEFFDAPDATQAPVPSEQPGNEIDPEVFRAGNNAEDIALVRAQGLNVDDDNDPAPENIPTADAPIGNEDDGLFPGQSWGVDSFVDPMNNNGWTKPPGFNEDFNIRTASWLDLFIFLFPITWFKTVLIPKTNENLQSDVTFGEMLRYIGLRLRMASVGGAFSKDDYWSTREFDGEDEACPYNFRPLMSKNRFDTITSGLSFTDLPKPTFIDKFWEVRQMIAEWNKNMAAVFSAGWVVCLDESMSIWHNRWSCPGWVFCPRKPHPYGNEYHTACCALCGILFVIELVQGKDYPTGLGTPEFEALCGKTGGLLLRMLKSIFSTGRYIVLDSGFCVLKAIVALYRKGLYAGALIKKRRYWPTLVPGEAMDARFAGKAVGDVDQITGVMENVNYKLFGMKEPDYVMKMMATGGVLESDDSCKMTKRGEGTSAVTFRYPKPIDWHFRYRHAVDDHNNLRHAVPSIEGTWLTNRWPIRVFAFLLAITEVNMFLALRFFVWTKEERMELVTFRRKFSGHLINNPWLPNTYGLDEEADDWLDVDCDHVTAPEHAKEYRNRQWVCTAKARWQQYVCKAPGCKLQVRTCCACRKGYWLCTKHIIEHVIHKERTR